MIIYGGEDVSGAMFGDGICVCKSNASFNEGLLHFSVTPLGFVSARNMGTWHCQRHSLHVVEAYSLRRLCVSTR
jgi:hypothetical protein